jgi:DNA polymerase-3 subunit epsilon
MRALVFDTETTGLLDSGLLPLDKQPEIIELYAVLVDLETGEEFDEFDELIKPQRPPSEAITRITGISNDMLVGRESFEHFAPRIKTMFEAAPLVIAHNASFDGEMMDNEFKRLGQTLSWPRIICSVEATISMAGIRLNLTALHERLFGEGFPSAHRAKNDVMALVKCLKELYRLGEI